MFLKKLQMRHSKPSGLKDFLSTLKNIVFGIIYRQHNSPDYFLTYLDKTIEQLVSDDKDVYIMGDFNIDLFKCESSQIRDDFLLSPRSSYLIPVVDKPTRVHRTSATLIDNIFVSNPDQLLASGNNISDISDHFAQLCITTSAKDKLQQVKNIKIRDYSRFSAYRFNDELSEVDWNRIIVNGANCVNKLFSSFYNKYNTIVHKHATMNKLSNRKVKHIGVREIFCQGGGKPSAQKNHASCPNFYERVEKK